MKHTTDKLEIINNGQWSHFTYKLVNLFLVFLLNCFVSPSHIQNSYLDPPLPPPKTVGLPILSKYKKRRGYHQSPSIKKNF